MRAALGRDHTDIQLVASGENDLYISRLAAASPPKHRTLNGFWRAREMAFYLVYAIV